MNVFEEKLWWDAFCAALTGLASSPISGCEQDVHDASDYADEAVKIYCKRHSRKMSASFFAKGKKP